MEKKTFFLKFFWLRRKMGLASRLWGSTFPDPVAGPGKVSALLPGVGKWEDQQLLLFTAEQPRSCSSKTSLVKCSRRDYHKPSPGNRAGILTEATDRGDVVCGQCNKGWVEWLILLLVVQDFWLTARKTMSPTIHTHHVPHIPLRIALFHPFGNLLGRK